MIRKLGYSLRRPIYRYVQATDKGVKEFHEELKKLRHVLKSNGKRVILFEDETGFSLHPKLGKVWAKKGTQPYVYTRSQHHHQLNIFGWIDPVNGRHGILKWIKGNTFGFLKMLTQIIHRFI